MDSSRVAATGFPAPLRALARALLLPAVLAAAAAAAPSPGRADPWGRFLARYLDTSAADGVNRVRYAAVTPADRRALENHLRAQQAREPSALPRADRMAYWIDLYNARTVALVLEARPAKSILEISPAADGKGKGPWKAPLLEVEGRKLSLDDVENAVLRPEFGDPRVHFALNCASLGCPELAPAPYARGDLDARLDRAARAFLASRHGAAFADGSLRLSSLFEWYRADFGRSEAEVLARLARLADGETAARLRAHKGRIAYGYDWTLNAAP